MTKIIIKDIYPTFKKKVENYFIENGVSITDPINFKGIWGMFPSSRIIDLRKIRQVDNY